MEQFDIPNNFPAIDRVLSRFKLRVGLQDQEINYDVPPDENDEILSTDSLVSKDSLDRNNDVEEIQTSKLEYDPEPYCTTSIPIPAKPANMVREELLSYINSLSVQKVEFPVDFARVRGLAMKEYLRNEAESPRKKGLISIPVDILSSVENRFRMNLVCRLFFRWRQHVVERRSKKKIMKRRRHLLWKYGQFEKCISPERQVQMKNKFGKLKLALHFNQWRMKRQILTAFISCYLTSN